MITNGSQTSKIAPNSNKKPLARLKDLSENLSLKLLCDVIFFVVTRPIDVPSFKMANFQLHDYPW